MPSSAKAVARTSCSKRSVPELSGLRLRPAPPETLFAVSEAVRWLRPWMAVVVTVLAVVTVFTAFAEDMPAFHHVAVPAATAVVLAAWALELSGLRWPRLALILGVG